MHIVLEFEVRHSDRASNVKVNRPLAGVSGRAQQSRKLDKFTTRSRSF